MNSLPSSAIALLVAALLHASLARADFFSQSPGPLASAHEKLDSSDQCGKCHEGGRALANDKCLACHEPIKQRIADGKGFHASARASGKPCFLCHTDHKGRARDILGFAVTGGRDKFDHDLAGWPLQGKHILVACATCHPRPSFLAAKPACEGCHKSPHGDLRPSLSRCERCHDANSWRSCARPEFDHDKSADARFALETKHAAVRCLDCHPKWQFRATGGFAAPDCTPCHENAHGETLFGKKRCGLCHSSKTEWRVVRFDHARQTRFPLDGAHASKNCAACHTPTARAKPERLCASCHKDIHAGRFAAQGDCASCHSTTAWRADLRFDHRARTRFPLAGKHAEAACRDCHRGADATEWERFDAATVGCMGCHQHADVHKKQFADAECLRCHTAPGKSRFKRAAVAEFHGPAAKFPLTEGHARVACERCHQNDVYKGTPTACGPVCHADELHRGSLGNECLRCHEGGHWAASKFDHDDTRYPLVGHHQDAACDGCHPARRFVPTASRCAECHGKDDAHRGQLGDRCERCHSPTGRSLFDHNDPAAKDRFRLVGRHLQVRCKSCHPSTVFPSVKTDCEGCHPEPNVHRGRLGRACGSCHDPSSWKSLHTGHDVGSFKFGGAHDRQRCEVCHPGGQLRRGTGELCITCHRGDDIHHNTLGPRCLDCHSQETWAGARFLHERVGCELRGIHRTLPCNDCHVGGHFAALSPACGACHRVDAIKGAASDRLAPPGHAGLSSCSSCHNVNFFAPARPSGSESICR